MLGLPIFESTHVARLRDLRTRGDPALANTGPARRPTAPGLA